MPHVTSRKFGAETDLNPGTIALALAKQLRAPFQAQYRLRLLRQATLRRGWFPEQRVILQNVGQNIGLHGFPLDRQMTIVQKPFVLELVLRRDNKGNAVTPGHVPHDIIVFFCKPTTSAFS